MFTQLNQTFATGLEQGLQRGAALHAGSNQGNNAETAALRNEVAALTEAVHSLKAQSADNTRQIVSEVLSQQVAAGGYAAPAADPAPQEADPRTVIDRMLKHGMYEEAFTQVLSAADLGVLNWFCSALDPSTVLHQLPLPISQAVLLSLIQQLGEDLKTQSPLKLNWLQESLMVLSPEEELVPHVPGIIMNIISKLDGLTASADGSPESAQLKQNVKVLRFMAQSHAK